MPARTYCSALIFSCAPCSVPFIILIMTSFTTGDQASPSDCINLRLPQRVWCGKCTFFATAKSKNPDATCGKRKNSSTKCKEPFHERNQNNRYERKRLAYKVCSLHIVAAYVSKEKCPSEIDETKKVETFTLDADVSDGYHAKRQFSTHS